MTIEHAPSWRVRRTGGLLVPGFSKRFDPDGSDGMTYLLGIPVGRFDVVASSADDSEQGVELRYRRWPIVDVLADSPVEPARGAEPARTSMSAAGYVRLPGGRRLRFCRFRLDR